MTLKDFSRDMVDSKAERSAGHSGGEAMITVDNVFKDPRRFKAVICDKCGALRGYMERQGLGAQYKRTTNNVGACDCGATSSTMYDRDDGCLAVWREQ